MENRVHNSLDICKMRDALKNPSDCMLHEKQNYWSQNLFLHNLKPTQIAVLCNMNIHMHFSHSLILISYNSAQLAFFWDGVWVISSHMQNLIIAIVFEFLINSTWKSHLNIMEMLQI